MSPVDKPSEQEALAQYERICQHDSFRRSPKRKQILEILIKEWLKNGGKDVDEKLVGEAMGETRVPAERETPQNHGHPKTRSHLNHVRYHLGKYQEIQGYLDQITIKMNMGSYALAIGYNRDLPITAKVDPFCDRVILRAKTAIDTRKFSKLLSIMDYVGMLEESGSRHPRVIANITLFGYVIAPYFPSAAIAAQSRTQKAIEELQSRGAEPWELSFVRGCLHATRDHEWHKALGFIQTAVANSQGEASFFWWYTALLAATGSIDQAIEILDSAVHHFARNNVAVILDLATLQIMRKHFSDAQETLVSLSESGSGELFVVMGYFMLLDEAQDNLDDALQEGRFLDGILSVVTKEDAETFWAQAGWHFLYLGMYALVLARLGRMTECRNINQLLGQQFEDSNGHTSVFELALPMVGYYCATGDPKFGRQAVKLLEAAAFDVKDPIAMWFHVFPPLRHLDSLPEFQDLLRRLNLTSNHGR